MGPTVRGDRVAKLLAAELAEKGRGEAPNQNFLVAGAQIAFRGRGQTAAMLFECDLRIF